MLCDMHVRCISYMPGERQGMKLKVFSLCSTYPEGMIERDAITVVCFPFFSRSFFLSPPFLPLFSRAQQQLPMFAAVRRWIWIGLKPACKANCGCDYSRFWNRKCSNVNYWKKRNICCNKVQLIILFLMKFVNFNIWNYSTMEATNLWLTTIIFALTYMLYMVYMIYMLYIPLGTWLLKKLSM